MAKTPRTKLQPGQQVWDLKNHRVVTLKDYRSFKDEHGYRSQVWTTEEDPTEVEQHWYLDMGKYISRLENSLWYYSNHYWYYSNHYWDLRNRVRNEIDSLQSLSHVPFVKEVMLLLKRVLRQPKVSRREQLREELKASLVEQPDEKEANNG